MTRPKTRRLWPAGVALAAIVSWLGCADDGSPVDVGEPTFGAEILVTVVGQGKVTSSLPGIDCGATCFASYRVRKGEADNGVTLTATPAAGYSFVGFSFTRAEVGTRGARPTGCSPVVRASSDPGPSLGSDLGLAFGEVAGAPPAGQEVACAGATNVPLAYLVTAKFSVAPGDGGEVDPILYDVAGQDPRVVGIESLALTENGRLIWLSRLASGEGVITVGETPTKSPPQSASFRDGASYGGNFQQFRAGSAGAIFTTSQGLFVLRDGATSPIRLDPDGAFQRIALDPRGNAYAQRGATIASWTADLYSAPGVVSTIAPAARDLRIDSPAGPLYLATPTAIAALTLPGADGGVEAGSVSEVVTSLESAPSELLVGETSLWWSDASGRTFASASLVSSNRTDTSVPPGSSVHLARDVLSPSYLWVASDRAIFHAYYFGGTSTERWRSTPSAITGLAVSTADVFWSGSDGKIRRVPRGGI